MYRLFVAASLVLAPVTVAVPAFADEVADAIEAGRDADNKTLAKLHCSNKAEIDLANLALEKSHLTDVVNLANMIKADHTAADERVMAVAQSLQVNVEAIIELTREGQLETELQQLVKRRLSNLNGYRFNRAYAQEMVDGHASLLRTLDRLAMHIDQEAVRTLVTELKPKIEEHKQHAEAVLRELSK